jgi:hypothetical protein
MFCVEIVIPRAEQRDERLPGGAISIVDSLQLVQRRKFERHAAFARCGISHQEKPAEHIGWSVLDGDISQPRWCGPVTARALWYGLNELLTFVRDCYFY